MASGFTLDTSRFKSAKSMEKKLDRALFAVCKYWDGPIETHMRHNAPWRDRTTNARNGLSASAVALGAGRYAILLIHTVTYGLYLELGTSRMKARPIIAPTVDLFAPKVMAFCTKLLDRLDRQV